MPFIESVAISLAERRGRLLRYPILMASRSRRDKAVQRLNDAGLGASEFYAKPLNCVEGVPGIVREQGGFPSATEFASHLLTLPLHVSVTAKDLARMADILHWSGAT